MSNLWPHQTRGVEAVLQAVLGGARAVVLSSPTGGGKSRIACELIDRWLDGGLKVAVYTRRRVLVEQLASVLERHGIDFGARVEGHKGDDFAPVQLCSMQTENSRVFKRKEWVLFPADRVIVDEAHDCTGPVAAKIIDQYLQDGSAVVGLSATPLGLGELYEVLIQAGTNSELRACRALVPALHYAPDEPDMKQHRSLQAGALPTDTQNRKIMRPQVLFGSVLKNLRLLNPELRPTILFASGVAESLWFAEELTKAGVPAAHVDGEDVWLGKLYKADAKARKAVLDGSQCGATRVVCNRYVLREGVDVPWLSHGIFATVFGSLQAYLQSGGRLLRCYPGVEQVTIQDHGGNWWRHGSLNADRVWDLRWTGDIERGLREDRQRSGGTQPGRCPACGIVIFKPPCRACGWESKHWKRSKPVMQTDGTLREQGGDPFRPRSVSKRPDGPAVWERMYWRSRTEKGSRTFRAAFALFAAENNWQWPDPSWPLMPTDDMDSFLLVSDVPMERLTQKGVNNVTSGTTDS